MNMHLSRATGGCARWHIGRVLQQIGHRAQHHCINPHDCIGSDLIFTSDKRFPGHADLVSSIQQLDSSAVDYRKPAAPPPMSSPAGPCRGPG